MGNLNYLPSYVDDSDEEDIPTESPPEETPPPEEIPLPEVIPPIVETPVVPIVTPTKDKNETIRLKLEATKIKDFSGNGDDWQKWKNRTRCAFSGSGYIRILNDHEFALENPIMNNTVYTQIAAATADGIAFHLVEEFEACESKPTTHFDY